jgi:hypothetical protein
MKSFDLGCVWTMAVMGRIPAAFVVAFYKKQSDFA